MSRWRTKLGIVALMLAFLLGTPAAFAWEEVPPGPDPGMENSGAPGGGDTDPDDFPIIMNNQTSVREDVIAPPISKNLLQLKLMLFLSRYLSI